MAHQVNHSSFHIQSIERKTEMRVDKCGYYMRWVPLFFAGVTAVLAKCGIKRTDSTVATAIRTVVVLLFSWLMVCLVTPRAQLSLPSGKTLCFLILSGLCTGASWLCYFRALQLGRINPVMAVDKSSTVLTVLFSFLFLQEPFT